MEQLTLRKVSISNIKGIEWIEFEVGGLTIIRGPNGVGKSSILDAMRTVIEGGHDPALIRQGEKKGEVVFTLSDGTTITKTITPRGQTTVVKTSDGQVVPAPMTFVNALASGFAFDPLAFVFAPHKERADYLTKVAPIAITADNVVSAVENRRYVAEVAKVLAAKVYDIPALNAVRKRVYDDRSGTNKTIRTLEGTIDTLRKTLPANWKPEGNAEMVISEAQTALDAAKGTLLDICHRRDVAVVEADRVKDRELADADAAEAAEIDAIRQKYTAIRKQYAATFQEYRDTVYHSLDSEIEEAEARQREAQEKYTVAVEQARHFQKQAETAAALSQYRKDLNEANNEAEMYSEVIKAIDAAKENALRKSPIPGMSVVDGEVMYKPDHLEEPIPFDNLNRQMQYKLSLQVAAQGAGNLGLMVVDNTEAMDSENWLEFKQACVESGFQVLAARVDDISNLDIESLTSA